MQEDWLAIVVSILESVLIASVFVARRVRDAYEEQQEDQLACPEPESEDKQ